MKKIIAAAALTLGLGAYSLPAFAQGDDYGQFIYTENEPSRFAPEGLPVEGHDGVAARERRVGKGNRFSTRYNSRY